MLSMAPTAPAVYVRWSTDEQGSGTTLEEQRQTCLSFLSERGWVIRQDLIFIDDGYSAGSLERPAMKRLRKAVLAGVVDAVVVYKLDRLTRNIVDAVDLVLKEWEGRCALVSVTQSTIDTTSPLGRQFFTLMASFAEFEREMIRDRTLSGKKRRAMQGRNPGFRPPYGYRIGDTPGAIVVDDERAAVVRRVFEMYTTGISMIDIARRFNKEALPSPSGSSGWQDRTVRYMLQNPMYIGRLEYGRTSRNSPQKRSIVGKSKTVHRAPRHAAVAEAVPPIITQELWHLAQQLMKARGQGSGFRNRAASSGFLLTGLLRCRCGYHCSGVKMTSGVTYYRCRRGPGICNSMAIRADVLEKCVMEAIRHQLRDRMRTGVLEAAATRLEASKKELEATIANLKVAMAEMARQRLKMKKDYTDGELTGRLYSQLMDELDQREGEMKASLQEAESALANPDAGGMNAAWVLENMDQLMSDTWETIEMGQKKHILRLLVPRITAYREKGTSFVDLDVTVVTPDQESGPVIYRKEHFEIG